LTGLVSPAISASIMARPLLPIKSVSTESNLMLAYEAKTVPRRGHTSTQWDRARLAVDAR
jgi:hypothetical protein